MNEVRIVVYHIIVSCLEYVTIRLLRKVRDIVHVNPSRL
jgi:hypothetical protein